MPVPAHRHRETFSHLIGSYGYILYGRVVNPLYIDVHLVAHGLVHWFTLSGRCTCPKMLNVKMNLFAFAETQLSRGALPHRQRVKGHGEAQVQQRIGGSMFLAV